MAPRTLLRWLAATTLAATALAGAGCSATSGPSGGSPATSPAAHQLPLVPAVSITDLVPTPVQVRADTKHQFRFQQDTVIHAGADAGTAPTYLAALLRKSTGFALPVKATDDAASTGVSFVRTGADPSVGDQGYQLDIGTASIVVRARSEAGLFAGAQTLHQLLPAAADSATRKNAGPWPVPAGHILDHPRYAYRGAMLDVSRHFFGVADVKRYIDEISQYKINYLHLHLSDDQGWRIAINGWPKLTTVGGATETGGGQGGYYTQADYQQIVSYGQSHYVTIVPEIDTPGHANAALHSYGQLSCDGRTPPAYTEIGSPNTALCIGKDGTYSFLDTVIGQLAALTPGPYLHIGGDEAYGVSDADYATFVNKVQPIVAKHGKKVVGWDQIVGGTLTPGAIAQDWDTKNANAKLADASHHGVKLIMSPAGHVYLDQKYNAQTKLGLHWAGYVEVKDSYNWDPSTYLTDGDPSAVIGVEAPLWSETEVTLADVQYMAFPRLLSAAELGWSPKSTHDWTSYAHRLGAQAPRWTVQGVNFYRSPQVTWATDPTG